MGDTVHTNGVLDPCIQCKKHCGERCWHIKRVRGHFCSKECGVKFRETHTIPKPHCWQCGKECGITNWRHRHYRGSKFCTKECVVAYERDTQKQSLEATAVEAQLPSVL